MSTILVLLHACRPATVLANTRVMTPLTAPTYPSRVPKSVVNVMIAIAETTGIEIPERDYPEVATFSGLVGYLSR